MGVPMVDKCCFCASLHTGTLLIGYLYSIWALLELAGYSLLVTLVPLGAGKVSTHKHVFFITAAAVSGTQLLCSVLLVVAAYKKLPSLTLPWTIVTGILTAVLFTLCLTAVSLVLQDAGDVLWAEAVVIGVTLLRACISVYSIVVVHSRHKQIMYEEQEARFQTSARLYRPVRTEDHGF